MSKRTATDLMLFGVALVCICGSTPHPSPDYRSAAMWLAGVCIGTLFCRHNTKS
jgi:hypothetical protein